MAKRTRKQTSSDDQYDEPAIDEDADNGGDDGFEETEVEMLDPPDDEDLAELLESEAAEAPAGASDTDVDENVLAAKSALEDALCKRVEAASQAKAMSDGDADIIQGVGIGAPEIDMDQIGEFGPGKAMLNVYVSEQCSPEEVRRTLFDGYSVENAADDAMPINVIETGMIDIQPHRHKQRPSPCGISVGHFRITAGTQGALATGRRAPRNRRVLMLSNNHVLADSNRGRYGDNILQPGRFDGGQNPRDRVGILERFVRVDFSGRPNFVDCATAWCWSARVRKEFIYRTSGGFRLFRVSSSPRSVFRGMAVGKTGRTTQLRAGRVIDTSATIRVNFGSAGVALFRDQIAIRGIGNRPFSAGGDSGSLIWTWDRYRRPVGLLFAGGGGVTFGNKIGRVLNALDIRLRT